MPPYITADLKKFLLSDYGSKLLYTAKLNGQDSFSFGKRKYKLDQLISLSESFKSTCAKYKLV